MGLSKVFQRGILRSKWIYDLCCGWSFLVLNSIYLNCQYSEGCKIYAFKNWDNGFLIIAFWFVVIRRWNFITSGRKPPLSREEFFTKKPSYRSNEEFMKSGRSGKKLWKYFHRRGFHVASSLFTFFQRHRFVSKHFASKIRVGRFIVR